MVWDVRFSDDGANTHGKGKGILDSMGDSIRLIVFGFLLSSVIAVPLARKLGLGSIIGYLGAGIAIGPFGLQFVRDPDAILQFAEFGVVLMLFLIGLELQPWEIRILRKLSFDYLVQAQQSTKPECPPPFGPIARRAAVAIAASKVVSCRRSSGDPWTPCRRPPA